MRPGLTAAALSALALAAAPAALARGTVTIDSGLAAGFHWRLVTHVQPAAISGKDRLRSCQAGARRSSVPAANETERKASTVACEQPPRSNLNVSSGLKGAEAGAIAAAG